MGVLDATERRMTVAEFLAWDDGTDRRYQLIDGEPVMMAPASDRHGTLVLRLGSLLLAVLDQGLPFRAQIEAGIAPRAQGAMVLQADLVVTDEPAIGQTVLSRPHLIAEVLSPSTKSFDRTVKLPTYQGIPSVQEILMIWQDRPVVERHARRDGERWHIDKLAGLEATLALISVPLTMRLADLYRGIDGIKAG